MQPTEQLPAQVGANLTPLARDVPDYTLRLLQHCAAEHLLPDDTLLHIRAMLQEAFYAQARWFAHGQSSTLAKAQAASIYESVLYQVDAALLCQPDDTAAIAQLRNTPIPTLLEQGRERILLLFDEAKERFHAAFACRLPVPMQAYQSMLHVQFDAFCRHYSARFAAKNACIDIDYPLLGKPAYAIQTEGIFLIHQYYSEILCENQFCQYFSTGNILALLIRYGKRYHTSYQELTVNIAELVCNQWFAALLCNRPAFSTILSNDDFLNLQDAWLLSDAQTICASLQTALQSVQNKITQPAVFQMLCSYAQPFANTFFSHVTQHSLAHFLVPLA